MDDLINKKEFVCFTKENKLVIIVDENYRFINLTGGPAAVTFH